MSNKIKNSFLIFFIFSSGLLFSQDKSLETKPPRDTIECSPLLFIPESELAFNPKERLKYKLNYRLFGIRTDVGEVELVLDSTESHNERKVFHSKAWGRTYKFWDTFFPVRDFYESKFFGDNLSPLYFHRNISEGKYTMKNYYSWNDHNSDIQARVQRMSSEPIDTVLSGQECTFDVLTLFYFFRNIDFQKIERGVNLQFSFAIDDDIFNLYFRYIEKKVKKIPELGKFKTTKFAAKLVAGEVFDGKQELIIWVSDDQNKIPLLFESPIIMGSVVGRLIEYGELKFPFNSTVELYNEK